MSSSQKSKSRFGYISTSPEDETASTPGQPHEARVAQDGEDAADGSGGERRGRDQTKRTPSRRKAAPVQELESVPKGQGRMKQARSQLNVRLPTNLKRQATAKAVLEGRDIGEVVEDLLRKYLDK